MHMEQKRVRISPCKSVGASHDTSGPESAVLIEASVKLQKNGNAVMRVVHVY